MSDCNWDKIRFGDMAVLVVFGGFFGHKMIKITPFGPKFGLPINLDLNDGQNKNKVHIFIVVAKLLIIWPKIGQKPLGRKDFKWAFNSVIFYLKVMFLGIFQYESNGAKN